MAKSSSNIALGKHVAVYSAALFVFVIPIISVLQTEHSTSSWLTSVFLWAAFNGVMHFGVDYITSRVNKSLYEQNRIHDFFVSVGFDQWVHFFFLFTSYAVLVQ